MAEYRVPIKYAFPLFTKHNSTDYLIKHDQIRVSDIWAFWQYIIGRYVKKYSGEKDFLLTLIEQARYFYEAAEKAPIKSQPLLYYYSFLNLVKVVINVNTLTTYGTGYNYYHGIEACDIKKKDKLQNLSVGIKSLLLSPGTHPRPGKLPDLSVAYTFMKQMGDNFPCPPKFNLNIVDMLKACVGIHRTYSETNNEKEAYIRLGTLDLCREGKTLRCRYEVLDCDANICAQLRAAGYNIVQDVAEDGTSHFKWIEGWTMSSYKETKYDYYMLAERLKTKGIWYYTDGNNYRTFISTSPLHISTESIIYNLMFFFGSITRYHPYMFDNLLTDQQMWLISEFLRTQPKQFLHAVTSRTIESAVLNPFPANDIL